MSYSQPAINDAPAQQFQVQTCKLVNHTFYVLLLDEGVITSELRRGKCGKEEDIVCERLLKACRCILVTHREEIRAQLDQLDLSPSSICLSYHQLANALFEGGCNWGKLVMLFTASSLIAARMCFSGHTELAESIREWLVGFILASLCKDWILQHDGWDSFPDSSARETANKLRRPAAPLLCFFAGVRLGLSFLGAINNPMFESDLNDSC